MNRALEDLILRFAEEVPSDLGSQLAWLEHAGTAADEAASELGDPAKAAALDLRAALGAFVEFSRGPQGPGEQLALELTVKSLIARALHTLYGALAQAYRDLGQEDIERASECRELSRLWSSLQRCVEKGEPIRPSLIKKLESIRQRVEG